MHCVSSCTFSLLTSGLYRDLRGITINLCIVFPLALAVHFLCSGLDCNLRGITGTLVQLDGLGGIKMVDAGFTDAALRYAGGCCRHYFNTCVVFPRAVQRIPTLQLLNAPGLRTKNQQQRIVQDNHENMSVAQNSSSRATS